MNMQYNNPKINTTFDMKKILSLLTLSVLFFSFSASAQDPKAKAILDKVSSKLKTMKSIKANFTFSMGAGSSKNTQKGTFDMKGSKYRVDLGAQQILCDGKSVWTYLKNNKEVQVASFDPSQQTVSPAKLFSGSYHNDYNSKYVGEQTIGGKKVDVVELTPKAGHSFKKLQLYVDKAGVISGGNMVDKSGSTYTYAISGVTESKLSDADFAFDSKKNPGVEVIDLR
jgi:outer membrane lipoprotein carrier protein